MSKLVIDSVLTSRNPHAPLSPPSTLTDGDPYYFSHRGSGERAVHSQPPRRPSVRGDRRPPLTPRSQEGARAQSAPCRAHQHRRKRRSICVGLRMQRLWATRTRPQVESSELSSRDVSYNNKGNPLVSCLPTPLSRLPSPFNRLSPPLTVSHPVVQRRV